MPTASVLKREKHCHGCQLPNPAAGIEVQSSKVRPKLWGKPLN
jgi:hypothetical protein